MSARVVVEVSMKKPSLSIVVSARRYSKLRERFSTVRQRG